MITKRVGVVLTFRMRRKAGSEKLNNTSKIIQLIDSGAQILTKVYLTVKVMLSTIIILPMSMDVKDSDPNV